MPATEHDDPSLIGEICHIVGRKSDGPRGASSLTEEERDRYENLILLCGVHHKLVDDQVNEYTLQRLRQMKADHEAWVNQHPQGRDPVKEKDDIIYAGYVDEWARRAHLEDWEAWTSYVLGGGQPRLFTDADHSLGGLNDWLFKRIWPGRYPELEGGFQNFRLVLSDFLRVFHEHAEGDDRILWTRKFYKLDDWNPPLYKRLSKEWDFHVALVQDLMLELTRAGNYLCDLIRRYLDGTFRLKEGVLIAESGPYMDLTTRRHRLEYPPELHVLQPYPGLDQFKIVRKDRGYHFGEGTGPDDPDFRVGD